MPGLGVGVTTSQGDLSMSTWEVEEAPAGHGLKL